MRKRRFICRLLHGPHNMTQTRGIYIDETPKGAADKFVAEKFPGETLYPPLRHEQPFHREDGEIYSQWSVATTASGQRIYIVEVD